MDISGATALNLIKGLAIPSDTTDFQLTDTGNYTGDQKKGHIPPGDQQPYYLQVFQRLY